MPKSANIVGIKSLRTYSIPEAAEVVGVCERTVGAWIARGLQAMTAERPTLVRGDALIAFIKSEREARKTPLAPDEFFCVKCGDRKKAAGGVADCETDGKRAHLTAICAGCDAILRRPIPVARIEAQRQFFDLTINSTENLTAE